MILPLIAIFGGSFDPLHLGHLAMANIVLKEISNTEIYFVPCGNPVHRAAFKTSAADRIHMIHLAIQAQEHFHIDDIEINSPKPSYTMNTLRYFREKFPNNPIAFIMGMDTFLNLDTQWGENWRDILNFVHLLVFPRAEYQKLYSPKLKDFFDKHQVNKNILHQKLLGHITLLDEQPPPVSSTKVRENLAINKDLENFLSADILNYIKSHHLYSNRQ